MPITNSRVPVFALICSISLLSASCKQQDAGVVMPTDESAAFEKVAQLQSLDTIIPPEQFLARLERAGDLRTSSDGAGMDVPVKVVNAGSHALIGKGRMPVNLGVQILGEEGSADSTGGEREFVRIPLPFVEAGSEALVVVTVPFDPRLDGLKVRIALVQEGSRWYETSDHGVLDLGPFVNCENRICDQSESSLEQ